MYKFIVSVVFISMSFNCFAYSPAIPPECKYYTSDDKLNELPAPNDLKKILGSDRGLKACLYHDGEWRYNITSPIQSAFGVSFFYEKSIYLWKASHSSAWENTPLNGKGVDERSLYMKLKSKKETFSNEDFIEVSDITVGTFKAILNEWNKTTNSEKLLRENLNPIYKSEKSKAVMSSFTKAALSDEKPTITYIGADQKGSGQAPNFRVWVKKGSSIWVFQVDIVDGELVFLSIFTPISGEVYNFKQTVMPNQRW